MSNSPDITFMLQYTEPNSQYVDYTNRDEAVRVEELALETTRQMVEGVTEEEVKQVQEAVPETQLNFREYIDYMNRSYATERQSEEVTAIFTQTADYLQRSRMTELKEQLEAAYQNGSLLWQGVLSFDNTFLAEQGLYDISTGQVDQKAIKAVMRDMMPTLIQKEGLSDSAFWWGNIHLNTDNIHIHFGLSEVESSREKIFYQPRGRMEYKGNFSQKTIQRFKSGVYHGLLKDDSRSLLLRKEQILANVKTGLLQSVYQEDRLISSAEKNFLEQAYNHLPLNKKWRYGSNAKDFAVSKFFLDKYLDSYFENEGKELYQQFVTETRAFLQSYEGVYSAEKNQTYEQVRKVNGKIVRTQKQSKGYDIDSLVSKRVQELRERLANTILKQFKTAPPQLQHQELESNVDDFSERNQEKIRAQLPEASLLKSAKAWEKQGYVVKQGEKPIEIKKPVYDAYDKNGRGIGRVEFVSAYVYDISQLRENIQMKSLTLKDLIVFSSSELKDLVEAAKQKEQPTEKERKELGTYRYALKLSLLEEKQASLLVHQKLLAQVMPLASDQPYVDFKKQALVQELKGVRLQLTPNYKLSESERMTKQRLSSQFEESVALPISKATEEAVQWASGQLKQELNLVSQIQDEGVLALLKGRPTTKQEYVEEIETHLSIFQLKSHIYRRNHILNQLSDGEKMRELKKANAIDFSELKKLYRKLDPIEEGQDQVKGAVSKQLQGRRHYKKVQQAQSQGKARIDNSFLRQISSSLASSQRANQKALMERIRSDEKEEQEERRRMDR
ncbi:TPA: MobP2 family relaxase [Streptococcus suis]